ncbi:MAG: GTPase domain-containing protein [Planctomycetota bacterium]
MNTTGPPTPPSDDNAARDLAPADAVYQFICQLIERYRECSDLSEPPAALELAEAALRLADKEQQCRRPTQLVVIGPTQVGKSTIVNMLLGQALAEVSPLAGFTVHPQAFWQTRADQPREWIEQLFPGWQRAIPSEMDRADLRVWSLVEIETPTGTLSEPANALPVVVWDTPDFDSLTASQYRQAVLESAALADVYLLVLSKEKYADLSVWNMLRLLEPLGRPLVICLNKQMPDSGDVVESSLRQRLAEGGQAWGPVPIVTMPYFSAAEEQPRNGTRLVTALRDVLVGGSLDRQPGLQALVARHWSDWTAPVRAEHAAIAEWNRTVESGLEKFVERYRRGYLEHQERYDAFRRATVELLHLLEIPKLGSWITKARQAVTWLPRQLWTAGREWRQSMSKGQDPLRDLGPEAAVLFDAIETLLTGLQRDAARHCDPAVPGQAVWHALAQRLESEESRLRGVFRRAIEAHHAHVTKEIHAVANKLYENLRRQPARLVALRTARATLDLGGLLLAVKTGGLTPIDVVWAPATFAVTSMLMEGFTELQMATDARTLKKRQYESVQQTLANQVLATELRELARNLSGTGLLGISTEQLVAAGDARRAWEQRDHA